jgi:hypothetical protein
MAATDLVNLSALLDDGQMLRPDAAGIAGRRVYAALTAPARR